MSFGFLYASVPIGVSIGVCACCWEGCVHVCTLWGVPLSGQGACWCVQECMYARTLE